MDEMKALVERLNKYAYEYYVLDDPTIADAEYDALYPEYGFAAHKGYPTFAHKLALFEFGPCPIHRRTFLSFLERDHDKLAKAFAEKESAKKARI